ncbi:hypothetical protein SeMB42_g07271 [Synchytrium endobioticum]|uniref:Uncharacterized protein n=1 Tax=Synchytrium endobioticum TaxID=286115 RepID=A0A507CB72_9FUNG|nr:hypothetical protein SeMB42_g07271 [Synchytrium endobioticum]
MRQEAFNLLKSSTRSPSTIKTIRSSIVPDDVEPVDVVVLGIEAAMVYRGVDRTTQGLVNLVNGTVSPMTLQRLQYWDSLAQRLLQSQPIILLDTFKYTSVMIENSDGRDYQDE